MGKMGRSSGDGEGVYTIGSIGKRILGDWSTYVSSQNAWAHKKRAFYKRRVEKVGKGKRVDCNTRTFREVPHLQGQIIPQNGWVHRQGAFYKVGLRACYSARDPPASLSLNVCEE